MSPKQQVPKATKKLTEPTLILGRDALRFLWGDKEAGLVSDWIYGSSRNIHLMAFSLSTGQRFANSADFKTYYNAAETYYCLKGEFTFHCPETGEIQVLQQGDTLYIPPKTWHFGYNFGHEECRVLESLAPPIPEAVDQFAAAQEPLRNIALVQKEAIGNLVGKNTVPPTRTTLIRSGEYFWHLHGNTNPVRVGLAVASNLLTTGFIELYPGQRSDTLTHPGDKIVYVTNGILNIRIWDSEDWWELGSDDTCFIPANCQYSLFNCGDSQVRLLFSVAPSYGSGALV
jgi:quercetin dioxygenase-like cupin family protein